MITNESSKKVFAGNGVTREWSYDFTLTDSAYLEVYLSESDGLPVKLTSGYTLDRTQHKVTYPSNPDTPALPTGSKLTLMRVLPITQPTDMPNQQGRILAKNTEAALDRATMIIQQLKEILTRTISFPVDYTGEVDVDNVLQMVTFNYERYPIITEARDLCVDAKAYVLPARDQTLEYRNTAEALVNKALSSAAAAYDNTKSYKYPDVVSAPDGFSYRCIATAAVTGEYPPTSPYWCRLIVDLEEFFTWDNDGDLMPEAYPTQSSKWSIDESGDIFPIY